MKIDIEGVQVFGSCRIDENWKITLPISAAKLIGVDVGDRVYICEKADCAGCRVIIANREYIYKV